MRRKPPPGGKRTKDWLGLRVALLRDIRTSAQMIPAGTVGTITYVSARGFDFESAPCEHCGVIARVTHIDDTDIEVAA